MDIGDGRGFAQNTIIFEPHWSAKTGACQGIRQISLFGLIVVRKQLMNYERVNLTESRNLFARCLGLGQFKCPVHEGMVKGQIAAIFA